MMGRLRSWKERGREEDLPDSLTPLVKSSHFLLFALFNRWVTYFLRPVPLFHGSVDHMCITITKASKVNEFEFQSGFLSKMPFDRPVLFSAGTAAQSFSQ